MDKTNWPQIFEQKSNSELLKILYGDSLLHFEAQILAGAELINRNYNKKIVLDHINAIVAELEEKRREISDPERISNYQEKFNRLYLIGIFSSVVFIILFIIRRMSDSREKDLLVLIGLPIYIIGALINRKSELKKSINKDKESLDRINKKLEYIKNEIVLKYN